MLKNVHMLTPSAQHGEAFHQLSPIFDCQFVPIPLAGVRDEAAHIGVMLRTVRHQGQLVGGMELDQAAGRWLLLQHLGPAIVGKDPLDEVLAEGHVVEPALLLQGQQGKAVHDLAGEHAGGVALRHAVFVIHLYPEQTRRGGVLFIGRDSNDKTSSKMN